MKKVIILSSLGVNQINYFEDKSIIDVFLLDHLRSYTSRGHKAFAIVLDQTDSETEPKSEYVIIKDNCTLWMNSCDFFQNLN